jgi:glutathione S-transferase
MYRLYSYPSSANCYKVDLLFHQLGIDVETVDLDIEAGQTHTSSFRKLNPFEMTPALESTETGEMFVESNAILWHFGRNTRLGPTDARSEYEILKWMFFEQNSLEPNIGRARRILLTPGLLQKPIAAQLGDHQRSATSAIQLLDQTIGTRKFLVNDRYGIADIAVFAYTHVAPQGGVSLEPFTNVRRWIANVESAPRYKVFQSSQQSSCQ